MHHHNEAFSASRKRDEVTGRRLPLEVPDFKRMIEAVPVRDTELELDKGSLGKPIIDGFNITSLDGSGFSIQFTFNDPLRVSTGVNPDQLLL